MPDLFYFRPQDAVYRAHTLEVTYRDLQLTHAEGGRCVEDGSEIFFDFFLLSYERKGIFVTWEIG